VHGQGHTGGIIGQSGHGLTIIGCSVIADVSSEGTVGNEVRVGGMVGQHTAHTIAISNSFMSGTVSATAVAREAVVMSGGMAGYLGAQSTVRNCYVEGHLEVTGTNHRGAWVGGVAGNINAGGGLLERNFVSATMFASATSSSASGMRYTRVGGIFTTNTDATQSTIRNNAIKVPSITSQTSPARIQAGVGVSATAHATHSLDNNNQLVPLTASVGSTSGWSRHEGTVQLAEWFEDQENFENDMGWCFADDWVMLDDENGIRPIPQAYESNVLEFKEKLPMHNPSGNTTEGERIKELENDVTTLTKERDELKEQAGVNEARLAELENELKEALDKLQDMIDEMKENIPAPNTTNPSRNTFDIWLFVSVVLAVVCVTLLVIMIIIGRRKKTN
jgi:deoxycytidylate deaminase